MKNEHLGTHNQTFGVIPTIFGRFPEKEVVLDWNPEGRQYD
jgi:hypothetical protein